MSLTESEIDVYPCHIIFQFFKIGFFRDLNVERRVDYTGQMGRAGHTRGDQGTVSLWLNSQLSSAGCPSRDRRRG